MIRAAETVILLQCRRRALIAFVLVVALEASAAIAAGHRARQEARSRRLLFKETVQRNMGGPDC
jgi:hypothetical protein